MNRREITKLLGCGLLTSALAPPVVLAATGPQVAITMDDFHLGDDEAIAEKRTRGILSALRAHKLKAAMFVAGRNIDSPLGKRMLELWDDEGHLIANHTYSHRFYPRSDFRQYSADILRCEALIKDCKHFTRLFRFPYLKEGETVEQRDQMRAFLAEHNYRNGAVTIDASDWYIDSRLTKRRTADANAKTSGYRDYYRQHVLDRSKFYDEVSRRGLGRSVKHTLLVHHNDLNAMFLGDVLEEYQKQGWKLIDAKEAFTDPVFDESPDVLPSGDSLVLALAVQNKKMQRPRWPMEDGEHEAPHMDKLGL